MNPGTIWWGQIGNSIRFLTKVVCALRDGNSAVLQVPPRFPWKRDFYEAVDLRRSAFGGERRMMRLPWEESGEPGMFVLENLCSREVRAEYWPGLTYAAYLASLDDIVLNDYYVWITGIHRKSDLAVWVDFVSQYRHHAPGTASRAVFLLEYDGEPMEVSGMESLTYSVARHDCRVFCLETAAALGNTGLDAYQAELALCMGETCPELSCALLLAGERLLLDPVNTALEVMETGCFSDGTPFPVETEQQISSAAWRAAIGLLFPLLEQYRLNFISGHEQLISRHLPISNSNGQQITDPYDLEIGPLQHIVSSARDFTPHQAEEIRLCRKVRNLLAHNRPVPYGDVKKVFQL